MPLKERFKKIFHHRKEEDTSKGPIHPGPSEPQSSLSINTGTSYVATINPSGVSPPVPDSDGAISPRERPIQYPNIELLTLEERGNSMRQLWAMAYKSLRDEEDLLVNTFEDQIRRNLPGIVDRTNSHANKMDWMSKVLQNQMDEVKRHALKLRFGNFEVEAQDVVKSALAVVDWSKDYVTKALSSNPTVSIAWGDVTLLLPLLLNPIEQASSLAKGLEHIASTIVWSYMWEDLYYRRALEMLFQEVLRFQIVCYGYYSQKFVSRLALDSVKNHGWDELLGNIKYRENEFDKVSQGWRDKMYNDEWEKAEAQHQQAMNHRLWEINYELICDQILKGQVRKRLGNRAWVLILQLWTLGATESPIKRLEDYMAKGERPDIETPEAALMSAVSGFSAVFIVIDTLDECPVLDGSRVNYGRILFKGNEWYPYDGQVDNLMQRPYCYTAAIGSLELSQIAASDRFTNQQVFDSGRSRLSPPRGGEGGHIEIVRFLLNDRANSNTITGGALQAAASRGHLAVMKPLLDNGADIDAHDEIFGSALEAAAQSIKLTALRTLLDCGANLQEAGCPVSCLISAYGSNYQIDVTEYIHALKLLFDKGVDINRKCTRHGSALNEAIKAWLRNGTRTFFDSVVRHNADIELNDGHDGTPLQAACVRLSGLIGSNDDPSYIKEAVLALLRPGVDPNTQGGEYGNLIQKACYYTKHYYGVVELLLEHGAEINQKGCCYGTAITRTGGKLGSVLQAAACLDTEAVVESLLMKGAEVNMKGELYGTAHQSACVQGSEESGRLLLSYGAEINIEGGRIIQLSFCDFTSGNAENYFPEELHSYLFLIQNDLKSPEILYSWKP
ncbi:ankyrin repeat [Fusarium agapanthi]|uniref:Ankyrin repeat n=1 Tax=Fusarium agapanthi TaxID=1803897 RepID=A0A9P5AYL7_9HYPO|nr:ankyrin repeat [Fusarium agapanthi]